MTEAAITETAEFKEAVAIAVKDKVTELLPSIVAQIAATKGDGKISSGDQAFADGLAMAIAQLTDQGTGRKRVAPEIIKQREDARSAMTKLIIEARAHGHVPRYTLRNKVYLDEVLVDPFYMDPATKRPVPTEIGWPGIPNEAMVPLNDIAKGIHEAFVMSIGSTERVRPEDALGMTPNGLVVKGKAVNGKRALPTGEGQAHSEGLTIAHRGRGEQAAFKEIPVLGTVAAPARQAI